MQNINSYPSVMQIGHKMITNLFEGDVLIEEKLDGSQISFGLIEGELVCRSKGKQQILDAPDSMFLKAIEVIRTLDLHPEWAYRGEYLQKPKHNTLVYSRIPKNHIIIYDINIGLEDYLTYDEKAKECERLGLEVVPIIFQGIVEDFSTFSSFMDRESVLGGCKIEGIVVKNYNVFTKAKKVAMGKYVSDEFRETHETDWKTRNPSSKALETMLGEKYRTKARWAKATQHLKEAGKLEGSPRDIGCIIKEIPNDIQKECEDEIKAALFDHFWPKIRRITIRGFPEWYKEELAKNTFGEGEKENG